jgi:hypothetical protein
MMAKRMTRIKRIKTDLALPSATPSIIFIKKTAEGGKIR